LAGFIVLRHEDKSTYGVPDMSVTGCGKTSWWEIKFANPDFNSRGIQDLTLRRLGNVGLARYIVYEVTKEKERFVHIVYPRDLADWRISGEMFEGFDHLWVIEKIRELHK
jgi:hypothetical protein